MAYTNSSMVVYKKLSPNHSGQRTHSIDRITPHCVVGQCTAEGLGEWFEKQSTQASSNYGIDRDGRVALYVEEKNRSWCSSSNANDQRAITIECASDTTEPYAFRDVVYQTLIKLCIDICKRNGKNKLIWFGDKDKTLNYAPKSGEMILTVHRWFANKSCPGNWMYAKMGDLAEKVTKVLQGSSDSGGGSTAKGTQASVLKDLSEADAIKKVGALFTADQKKSGILASVSLAQFILESGYGKSELAQNANNIFGMKCSLSGNTWSGSSWDGKSKYTKKTQEQNPDRSMVTITADFRKYPCIEDSITDHSAYLLGAKNGSKLRYAGLKECTQFDAKDSGGEVIRWYHVRKSWADVKSQKGAYKILDNAKKCADQNPGYKVFDADGKVVYEPKAADPAVKVPFLVKVSISDLNIRKGPGTDYDRVQFIPIGVYTILEVRSGKGSSAGWGRLKSGIGWISLDFVRRI